MSSESPPLEPSKLSVAAARTAVAHIDRQEAELEAWLDRILPLDLWVPSPLGAIRAVIDELCGLRAQAWLVGSSVADDERLRRSRPDPNPRLVLSSADGKRRWLLELELGLAMRLVDAAMKVPPRRPLTIRPLNEVEAGVLTFLALAAIERGCARSSSDSLTLLALCSTFDEGVDCLGGSGPWCSVAWRVEVERRVGRASVIVSADDVARLAPLAPRSRLRPRLGEWRWLKVRGRVFLGTVPSTPAEVAQLDAGDVVLVDADRLHLRFGLHPSVVVTGELVEDRESRSSFLVASIERSPPMHTNPAPEEETKSEPDIDIDVELDATQLILEASTLPLEVQLGSVEMTVEQLLRLRPGQLIGLNRSPRDLVSLAVGGRVVAEGELVEFDGRLGVRVVSIRGRKAA